MREVKRKKEYFLLLLAVPMDCFVLYCFQLFSFDSSFSWGSLMLLSFFVFSVTFIMTMYIQKWKVMCCCGLHFFLVGSVFAPIHCFGITKEQLWMYCLYEIPALFLIGMFADEAVEGKQEGRNGVSKNQNGDKKKKRNEYVLLQFVFDVYVLIVTLVLLFRLLSGVDDISFVLNGTVGCYLLFLLFFAFCFWRLSSSKTKALGTERRCWYPFLGRLIFLTGLDGVAYLLFFNHIASDIASAIFPLFLTVVLFFHRYPEAGKVVFLKVGTR